MVAYARAHVIKYAIFTVEGTSYANQVNKVRFVPDTPIQQMRTLIPDGVITDSDSTTWTLELGGVQDFGAGSLGAALKAGVGIQLDVVFQPKNGVGQDHVEAVITGMPMEIGGEQGSFRTFDIVLPVVGEPTITQSV